MLRDPRSSFTTADVTLGLTLPETWNFIKIVRNFIAFTMSDNVLCNSSFYLLEIMVSLVQMKIEAQRDYVTWLN